MTSQNELYPQLSTSELVVCVLEMAQGGVYREDAIEALSPCASRKQVEQAIRIAREFGLKNIREFEGQGSGGYYSLDWIDSLPTVAEVERIIAGKKELAGMGRVKPTVGFSPASIALLCAAIFGALGVYCQFSLKQPPVPRSFFYGAAAGLLVGVASGQSGRIDRP